jgi:uncharacterized membrane protein
MFAFVPTLKPLIVAVLVFNVFLVALTIVVNEDQTPVAVIEVVAVAVTVSLTVKPIFGAVTVIVGAVTFLTISVFLAFVVHAPNADLSV